MAIFHMKIKIINRRSGRSAVASAAYRSGEKLVNDYDGLEHDYTRKNWIEHKEIILPESAPKEYKDRSSLWNAVEKIEKSSVSRLSREFEIALPKEMTLEQQIEVAKKFVEDNIISLNLCADICIHNPPVMNDRHQPIDEFGNPTKDVNKMIFRNPHAHIMTTLRPLDEVGRWQKKSEVEYICKCGDEEKKLTANELKLDENKIWQKQYKYINDKEKMWLTKDEGEALGLKRVNRTPRTTVGGRLNPHVEYINDKARVFEWRENWEKIVNEKFKDLESDTRIDHRSYKDQGKEDILPTQHMGPSATNMERRAMREIIEGKNPDSIIHSELALINKQIKEHNRFVIDLRSNIEKITKSAKEYVEKTVHRLNSIRVQLIGNLYDKSVMEYTYNKLSDSLIPEKNRLSLYRKEIENNKKQNEKYYDEIVKLQKNLKSVSHINISKRNNIIKQISKFQNYIEINNQSLIYTQNKYDIHSNNEFIKLQIEINNRQNQYQKLSDEINNIQEDNDRFINEYKELFDEINNEQTLNNQKLFDSNYERLLENELYVKYKNDYKREKYISIRNNVDKMIKNIIGNKDNTLDKKKTNKFARH